jgi:transcriptional regulator with XRE-family HTH domain
VYGPELCTALTVCLMNDVSALLRGIGRRVAELRAARGITQEELAAALDVSLSYVRQVEGGSKNLSVRSLAAFADVVGARVPELFEAPREAGPKRGRPRKG